MTRTCCPYCGGEQGIGRISRWERYEGTVGWGQREECDTFEATGDIRGGKYGYCLDCNKRVLVTQRELEVRK